MIQTFLSFVFPSRLLWLNYDGWFFRSYSLSRRGCQVNGVMNGFMTRSRRRSVATTSAHQFVRPAVRQSVGDRWWMDGLMMVMDRNDVRFYFASMVFRGCLAKNRIVISEVWTWFLHLILFELSLLLSSSTNRLWGVSSKLTMSVLIFGCRIT